MYGVDWSIDIDGRDPNGNFPDSGDDDRASYCTDEPVSIPSYTYRAPKYAFNSLEELATSEVFQTALTQALAHKDRVIHDLQQELIDIHYQASMNDSANDYQ